MTRAGITTAALASLAAAALVTGLAITSAQATDGAAPATGCATSTACVEGDNASTGPGVKGTSTKGHGIVGTTKSKGATQNNSHAGVLGQDLQTSGATGNIGVEGTSTNGIGVIGSSQSIGVFGSSAVSYGSVGKGPGGVAGLGDLVGVSGLSTSGQGVTAQGGTDGFVAFGGGGNLFRGNSTGLADVFTVDDVGNEFAAGGLFVGTEIETNGEVFGKNGAFGDSSTSIGVISIGSNEALEGEGSPTGDAIFANGFGGDLFRGNGSHGSDVFIVDDGGNVFANTFTGGLAQTTLQRTSAGATVKTYASQTAQPTLEDDGEAQLVNGVAQIALDPAFAVTIDRSNYMVMVTPEGMTRGVLCVVQRTPAGFVVEENMGGHSSVPFSYRIVAKPYGSTAPRLPIASIPAHFDRPTMKRRAAALPRVHAPAYHPRPTLPFPNVINGRG